MDFQDKVLKCIDCGLDFLFSAGEQLFFYDKQFLNEPKRCKNCKAKRAPALRKPSAVGGNVLHTKLQTQVTCAACGRQTTVPFRPTQGRPVLCRACFQKPKDANRGTSANRDEADIPRRHEVQFYSDDASFLDGLTSFIDDALQAGNPVIVAATSSHLDHLLQRLKTDCLNFASACEQGRYIPVDVVEMLSSFIVNGRLDYARSQKVVAELVAAALKTSTSDHPRVAACGEAAPALWAQGNADAALQLEHVWDDEAKTSNLDILCGYTLHNFQREPESHIYRQICAEHSVVLSHWNTYARPTGELGPA
jgi:CxxC-x17-CxxC domain-containing protein